MLKSQWNRKFRQQLMQLRSYFLTELLDKTSGFIYTTTQGQSLTWGCSGTVYGDRKFFCKDQCQKQEDVLVSTDKDVAQSSRYSVHYVKGSVPGLHVGISQLTTADSGWYRCGYGNPLSPDSLHIFQILVVDGESLLCPDVTLFLFYWKYVLVLWPDFLTPPLPSVSAMKSRTWWKMYFTIRLSFTFSSHMQTERSVAPLWGLSLSLSLLLARLVWRTRLLCTSGCVRLVPLGCVFAGHLLCDEKKEVWLNQQRKNKPNKHGGEFLVSL